MNTAAHETSDEVKRLGFLDIAVLVLSLYVLAALLAETCFALSPAVGTLL